MAVAPPSPPYVGPPRRHGGAGNKPIKRWVIHCTAGAEPGVPGAARAIGRYFRITNRAASAHYAADSRESVQCAWDSIVCYHAPPNGGSIGYELCCSLANEGRGHWGNDAHQSMLRIAAKDTARGCLAYGIPMKRRRGWQLRLGMKGICGHNDVRDGWRQTTHWDPGPHFPWKQFLKLVRAEARRLQSPTPRTTPTPAPEPETGALIVNKNDEAKIEALLNKALDARLGGKVNARKLSGKKGKVPRLALGLRTHNMVAQALPLLEEAVRLLRKLAKESERPDPGE